MPVVTVEIPSPKTDPILKELLREFKGIAESLRGKSPKDEGSSSKTLSLLTRQQDSLLKAVERMMAVMASLAKAKPTTQTMPMKELRGAFSGLAADLKSAVKSSYVKPQVTVKPEVHVSLNGLAKRFDRLEDVLKANGKSRNRTFGSNY